MGWESFWWAWNIISGKRSIFVTYFVYQHRNWKVFQKITLISNTDYHKSFHCRDPLHFLIALVLLSVWCRGTFKLIFLLLCWALHLILGGKKISFKKIWFMVISPKTFCSSQFFIITCMALCTMHLPESFSHSLLCFFIDVSMLFPNLILLIKLQTGWNGCTSN